MSMNQHLNGLANISEHDDEMFLEAFAAASSGEMTEPDLLMGKFEDVDAYEVGMGEAELFRSGEDVFFGSP